jgi:hypothetical protein
MKSRWHALVLSAGMVAAFALAAPASAQTTMTIVGPVTKIELASDGNSANATLTEIKSGAPIVIYVTDELTLDKFKDKRIQVGDEIRTRFDKGEKNVSRTFKKTAGC